MKVNAYITVLAAMSACAALSAADFSYEGRWETRGTSVENADTTCAVRFYDSADAAEAHETLEGVPFKTDSEGYFVISTNSPASLPDTFWVGVKPDGANEISPRFRVAPVPFALVADEVAIVTNDSEIAISGTARIERLDVSGDVTVKECVVQAGGTVSGTNVQASSVRLTGVTLDSNEDMLGLFDAQSNTMNLDYDSFPAQHVLETTTHVSTRWPFLRVVDSRTTERSASLMPFDTDGFLVAELKSEVGLKCPIPCVTLTIGNVKVLDNAEIGTAGGTVSRIMSIPCRQGETVSYAVKAIGAGETVSYYSESRYSSMIGIKLRFVRIGRY